jgi:hypothetical protein
LNQSRYYEMSTPLDYAVVHGRSDLHDRLQKEGLPTEIGVRMIWHEGPVLGGATMALGLALGCHNQSVPAFDLSRTMKPRPLLRDIFPWGELVCAGTLMALMGMVVGHHSDKLNSAYLFIHNQCEGNKILASSDATQLEKEKADLKKKLDSLHKFIDSRVTWTTYVRGISACLPANIQLNQWQAESALAISSKGAGGGKGKKSLRLGAEAPLTAGGVVPPEVGQFVTALRTKPLLKRDFPQADLMGIQQTQAVGAKPGKADFAIVCQSKDGKDKKGAK